VESVHRFNKGERSFLTVGPEEDRELGTALNDAVYFSVSEKMMSERGRRKVMIVFSDGEENSSEHDEVDAISAAQGADVLVYALRTTEHKGQKMNARDRYGMRLLDHITEDTGGTAFDLRQQEMNAVFASIAEDLKSLYEFGYYSTNTTHDGVFHKITVTVDGEGLKARTRAGYLAR
jgi:Ca-activated chloride channel homolog